MIPKIIHYCWFGPKEMPLLAHKCIDSWKKHFPDWEIRLWNEANSPMRNDYMQNAYANKKWANLANYTRLFALKNFGGIYFDTDVEVIRNFDFLEKFICFVGFETGADELAFSINNAVMGAVVEHSFINECLVEIESEFDGTEEAYLSSPVLTTKLLKKNGLNEYGEQDIREVHVFSMQAFYPYAWNDIFSYSCLTENTYAIHYWDMSWKDKHTENTELIQNTKRLQDYISLLEKQLAGARSGNVTISTEASPGGTGPA